MKPDPIEPNARMLDPREDDAAWSIGSWTGPAESAVQERLIPVAEQAEP